MRKILLVNFVATLLVIIIFDVLMYSFLPRHYVYVFAEYRGSPPLDIAGRGGYPNGYFVEHEERGFDIGRNKSGRHRVGGLEYSIWSNSLGCFDNEHASYDRYVYFAG